MWGLSGSRPRHCLKIGAESLVWGESSHTWRGTRRYRCLLSPTPAGSVKLSPMDPNLTDRASLEERLRSLAGPVKRSQVAGRARVIDVPRSITLMLPDLAIRASVLQLQQLPARPDEQEALIRWRLGQEQRIPMVGAKIIWQVFPSSRPAEGTHTILILAIQEAILQQYESICESVGLLPQEVAVTSFRLFDLWLRVAGGRRRLNQDLIWVTISDGGLTCLMIHEGRPIFVRTKLLTTETMQRGDDRSHEWVEKIVHETGTSLLACQERHPGFQIKNLVLVSDCELSGLEDSLGDAFGVVTEQLDWDHVESLGWSHEGGSTALAALPALAGLV
jgi:type IV pilus assembly protein PilM